MTTTEQTLLAAVSAALLLPNTGAGAANPGNSGNGTVANIQVAAPAIIGTYRVALTSPTAYSVTDPDGDVIGAGVVGQQFAAEGMSLVVMPGTVAFVTGDGFSVVVNYPTAALARVYVPRDWPTAPNQAAYPVILLLWPDETKTSRGPNAPLFDVEVTIRLIARVVSLPQKGDAGAAACLAAVGIIKRQVETAVINNFALYKLINEIGTVISKCEVRQEGEQHLGELTMDFAIKYAQGTADFAPINADPITEIAIYADLLDIFDPNGTYSPPFDYSVPAAPRTIGPDGRVEATASVPVSSD